MLIYGYDFSPVKQAINEFMDDPSAHLYRLKIKLEITAPDVDSNLIQEFSNKNIVKSYQRKEICLVIFKKLREALNNHLQVSLNKYNKFTHDSP